jgi:imidazolonepropionase
LFKCGHKQTPDLSSKPLQQNGKIAVRADTIWFNARIATMAAGSPGISACDDGLIATKDGTIVYAGQRAAAPSALEASSRVDLGGRWVTPGLIDCHTHLVFAGDRSCEFEQRLAGVAYADIARAGGGILSAKSS